MHVSQSWHPAQRLQRLVLSLSARVYVLCLSALHIRATASVCASTVCLREYHSYEQGNLCWEAALEAPSASLSAALIAYPELGLNADRSPTTCLFLPLPASFSHYHYLYQSLIN